MNLFQCEAISWPVYAHRGMALKGDNDAKICENIFKNLTVFLGYHD